MSYIYSKYNIAQKDIEDNYVLYNCLSNTYCIVREHDRFDKISSGEVIDPALVEHGFLVEEGTNEIALADYYLNQKIRTIQYAQALTTNKVIAISLFPFDRAYSWNSTSSNLKLVDEEGLKKRKDDIENQIGIEVFLQKQTKLL